MTPKPLLGAAGDKAGVKAFARGGLAMPGWAVVGEEGPELVNFSQPGARLHGSGYGGAVPQRDAGQLTPIRERCSGQGREVYPSPGHAHFLNGSPDFPPHVDMVEAWDAEGMPGVRA